MDEHSLTSKTLKQISVGKTYNIDLTKLDDTSLVEFRRLLRDLDDRMREIKSRK